MWRLTSTHSARIQRRRFPRLTFASTGSAETKIIQPRNIAWSSTRSDTQDMVRRKPTPSPRDTFSDMGPTARASISRENSAQGALAKHRAASSDQDGTLNGLRALVFDLARYACLNRT